MWWRQVLLILPSYLRQRMSLRDMFPSGLSMSVTFLDLDLFLDIGVLSGAGLASS